MSCETLLLKDGWGYPEESLSLPQSFSYALYPFSLPHRAGLEGQRPSLPPLSCWESVRAGCQKCLVSPRQTVSPGQRLKVVASVLVGH